MSFLFSTRTLKDARRRVVESVLEGVGATERTVDDEFDMFVNKFNSMMQDLNECKCCGLFFGSNLI